MNTVLKTSLLSISLLALPSLSMAEGGYFGFGFGQAKNDACDLVSGISTVNCEDTKTVLRVIGGYNFNQYIALEGGFNSLGEARATDPASTLSAKLEGNSVHFGVVGTAPVSESFAVFGKLGASRWDVEGRVTDSAGSYGRAEEKGFDPMYSVGIKWLNDEYNLQLEYERYEVSFDEFKTILGDNADVDIISLTYSLNF
ncbi:outer membrane beta-barrel protein [Kangiella spongicola]|uniref:Outer membrane protein OmpA-like transmembrane domain-containing protein n=1 Tax=Kangiella spongicola TaxID=796379 RepID=A0A318D840_9GAMM|nr:outer membrane beta-barrel protein [Kangiella spongicola]PXF63364.1 hypothetical protein DL796_07990 [Kangiella spongicola]